MNDLAAGRILKADTVRLRGRDPLAVPVEVQLEAARDEAFRQGFEQGYTAGALEAGAHLAATGERLRDEIVQAVRRHGEQVRVDRAVDADQLVELALAVAEWAVRRELRSVPEAFFARLGELLADRDRTDRVEILTSPAMVDMTREWLAGDAAGAGGGDIRVVASDDLDDGEARVSIGDTTVFATFAEAFERARAVIDGLACADEVDDGSGDGLYEDEESEEIEVLYEATPGGLS